MAKSKAQNEYLLVYAIFAHHRFKAVTVMAKNKAEAQSQFYETHQRDQYRIKTCLKVNQEDWEKTADPEEFLGKYGVKYD